MHPSLRERLAPLDQYMGGLVPLPVALLLSFLGDGGAWGLDRPPVVLAPLREGAGGGIDLSSRGRGLGRLSSSDSGTGPTEPTDAPRSSGDEGTSATGRNEKDACHRASFFVCKLAERAGFEPANGLPHYTLSRRACSTTPAPLREDGTPSAPAQTSMAGACQVGSVTTGAVRRWRRGRDSNPRNLRLLVFETSAFNRSATSPLASLPERSR